MHYKWSLTYSSLFCRDISSYISMTFSVREFYGTGSIPPFLKFFFVMKEIWSFLAIFCMLEYAFCIEAWVYREADHFRIFETSFAVVLLGLISTFWSYVGGGIFRLRGKVHWSTFISKPGWVQQLWNSRTCNFSSMRIETVILGTNR